MTADTEVRALMETAAQRWMSARATVSLWADPAGVRRAWSRHPLALEPMFGLLAVADTERPHEHIVRCWVAEPDLAREERDGMVAVRRGDSWWRHDAHWGTRSNGSTPGRAGEAVAETLQSWLDPAQLTTLLETTVDSEQIVAGRRAVGVTAKPRAGRAADRRLQLLGWGADSYRLLVDAERGVLLGATASLDGAEFRRELVLEIAFDEPLADELFAAETGVRRT